MKTKEQITHWPGDRDSWICICGNQAETTGFSPCNRKGNEVEPTPKDWKIRLYVCGHCGRIINRDTLLIVGRNLNPKFFP